MSAHLDRAIQAQLEVIRWTQENLNGEFRLRNRRDRLAFTCFDLAAEHHAAVVCLAQSQLFGSAFALLRVQFEALLRGLWLRSAATEEDIDRYSRGKVRQKTYQLLEKTVESGCDKASLLKSLKTKQWPMFNSFTHTGDQALLRRIGEETTGYENYPQKDVESCLNLSGLLGCMTASALAE